MATLLNIGSGDEAIVERLRGSGIDVTSELSDDAIDVVLIAPEVEAPLQVARRVHVASPGAHIVFLTTPATEAALRRELLVGRIGTHWSIAPADPAEAATGIVRQAIEDVGRRHKLRTTLGRVNLQLAQPQPAARRTLISDHFLASVLEQLSDAVVVLDPAGGVLAWNGAASRAFGDIRRGAPLASTLPPAVRDAIEGAAAAPDGRSESVMTPAEKGVEYALRATTLRDPGGEVIGIALVARDVTVTRKQERRQQLVADAVRVLASTLDVKEAMQKLTDLLVLEFGDVAAADIIEGDHANRYAVAGRSEAEAALMEQLRGNDVGRNRHHPSMAAMGRGDSFMRNGLDDETVAGFATGPEHLAVLRELHPHALAVAPLRGGDEILGAILVARTTNGPFAPEDIATLEEIARQAATALHNIWSYHSAAEASRLKDEFLATLSHELRTPMTSILGWAQILRLEDTPAELIRDGLESIERSARAQAQLIDDLLDLSRMQMGKVQFTVRPFSLPEVVRAAVETVRPVAQTKNIPLLFDAPDDVVVAGDPDRMQQVIWNLLSNAVKFSEAGNEVSISVTTDGDCAHVAVTDRGRGIAPEFLPHVFDRFRQADAATTRRFGGLGLGLAIVKQLVEMHGGTVKASSAGIGHGATFTVSMPLVRAARLPETEPLTSLADLTGLELLVVEDDAASARTLCTMLERAGANVRTARSAAAALKEIRRQLPDVMISDVAMPDEDGLSLIRSIRGTLRINAERLPAIALTAFRDVDLRVALLGAGFQRFMSKPVDAAELANVVAALSRVRPGNST